MFFEKMDSSRAFLLNPLVLAYIGDAVFSLYVRQMLVGSSGMKSGGLHAASTKFVSAVGQAKILDAVSVMFSERESDIARRARNAHNATKAKNVDLETYKKATSFEAVIGYLYLIDEITRMTALIEAGLKIF